MTREESVSILKTLIPKDSRGNGKVKTNIAITEAILNAVEALEQEPILDFIKDCKNKIENYGKDYMFTQEEVLNIIERYAIKYTKSFKWQESEEVNGR